MCVDVDLRITRRLPRVDFLLNGYNKIVGNAIETTNTCRYLLKNFCINPVIQYMVVVHSNKITRTSVLCDDMGLHALQIFREQEDISKENLFTQFKNFPFNS